MITMPLDTSHLPSVFIIKQDTHYGQEIISESLMAKSTVGQQNRERTKNDINTLTPLLSTDMRRSVNLSKESSWLTTLPLKTHGFTLHKQAFRDALSLRYGCTPNKLPSKCACGYSFTVTLSLV